MNKQSVTHTLHIERHIQNLSTRCYKACHLQPV